MLRNELQNYLSQVYPHAKVDEIFSLSGQVHIRFELGGNLENGTLERVNQAVERACSLFSDAFPESDNELWILIYEFPEYPPHGSPNDHLYTFFPLDEFSKFYNQKEHITSGNFTKDKNGNEIPEIDEVIIIIGKIPVSKINIEGILRGIASSEMGFRPAIDQVIYFFDPLTHKAFQMYDDRGCFIWSNEADTIRSIYENRNDWIVNYHRPEIDPYFK